MARWSRDADVATIARCILGTLKYEPHSTDVTAPRPRKCDRSGDRSTAMMIKLRFYRLLDVMSGGRVYQLAGCPSSAFPRCRYGVVLRLQGLAAEDAMVGPLIIRCACCGHSAAPPARWPILPTRRCRVRASASTSHRLSRRPTAFRRSMPSSTRFVPSTRHISVQCQSLRRGPLLALRLGRSAASRPQEGGQQIGERRSRGRLVRAHPGHGPAPRSTDCKMLVLLR